MRLIDAEKLKNVIEGTDWHHISLQGNLACGARSDTHTPLYKADDIYKALEEAPTVDAVEVVRCKDCKHYKEFRTKRNKQIMRLCCRMGKNDMEYSVKPDDFCSYGERKEGVD